MTANDEKGRENRYVKTVPGWEGMLVDSKTGSIVHAPLRFLFTPERGRTLANARWAKHRADKAEREREQRESELTQEAKLLPEI